jgi:hypothetical protein
MEAFYSLIYIKTNVLTDEYFAVGVFAGGGEGPFFYVSEARLRWYKDVVHRNTFLATRRQLMGLKQRVDKYRQTETGLLLFDPEFSSARFEELHKKSKGIIQYSLPTSVNDWMTERLFHELIQQFLSESQRSSHNRSSFHLQWANYRKKLGSDHHSINVPLSELTGRTQSLNIEVDQVDTKASEVYKGINFDLKQHSLGKHLYELSVLQHELNDFTVVCVYPQPKTKNGKLALAEVKEQFTAIRFEVFKPLFEER